jgi:hypothetical protein
MIRYCSAPANRGTQIDQLCAVDEGLYRSPDAAHPAVHDRCQWPRLVIAWMMFQAGVSLAAGRRPR